MNNRSTAGVMPFKRVAAAVLASALLTVGFPGVATSSAASPGAHNAVSAGFGDCKNDNSGKHNGYDCPSSVGNDGGSNGGSTTPTVGLT